MELKEFKYNFIDKIYDYENLYGRKSKCGLQIFDKKGFTYVIATDIYDGNPGGSVTDYTAELAMQISKEFDIDLDKMIFIQHSPELKSSLEFYREAFYKVSFENNNGILSKPDWDEIERKELEEIANS